MAFGYILISTVIGFLAAFWVMWSGSGVLGGIAAFYLASMPTFALLILLRMLPIGRVRGYPDYIRSVSQEPGH
ncbi:MAG: hypothetical protein ACI9IV_002077 [Paracoccaceae bacterium]|jgi:hypothetical protein